MDIMNANFEEKDPEAVTFLTDDYFMGEDNSSNSSD